MGHPKSCSQGSPLLTRWGAKGVLKPRCWMPCRVPSPPCSCWVVRWSVLLPTLLPEIFSQCDLGEGWQRRDGGAWGRFGDRSRGKGCRQ